MEFSDKIYRGYIIKGDLIGVIDYVKQFPEQAELSQRYRNIFEQEQYIIHGIDPNLEEILTLYQKYYRDVFYLCIDKEKAVDRLRDGLVKILPIDHEAAELDDIEEIQVAKAFQSKGLHFMGGRTGGYYGPYVWQTTESKTYEVELPEGKQSYTVKILDGFLSRSWMDYLSFGKIGTGGWTDPDGIINCVKSAYDLNSEAFQVSLLKHEAQHAMDLKANPNLPSADLEYRAKLVELIYSTERNLLEQFVQEGEGSEKDSGHITAARRITDGFARKLNLNHTEIARLPHEQVQAIAKELFQKSNPRL